MVNQNLQFSGLDPANLGFRALNLDRMLPTDAVFVDVIHTNSGNILDGAMSLPEPLGHVDFYPNGGSYQDGCTDSCFGPACVKLDMADIFGGLIRALYYKIVFVGNTYIGKIAPKIEVALVH